MKAHGQQHYTIANGFLSNEVYNSYKDSKGYIWFCTNKGVCRFNGKDFKTYTNLDGLPDNSVINFFEDRQGRLWLSCYNGGPCYIYQEKVYNMSNSRLLAKIPVRPFFRDMCNGPDSSVYIAYSSGLLIKIVDTAVTILTNNASSTFCTLQYKDDTLYAYDQHEGRLKFYKDKYIGTNPISYFIAFVQGNTQYIVGNDTILIQHNNKLYALYHNENVNVLKVIKIVPYKNYSFFCCTHSGLLLVDYMHHSQSWILKGMKVTSVCQSPSGNFYATTLNKGVYELNRELNDINFITDIGEAEIQQHNNYLFRITTDSIFTFNNNTLKQEPIKTKYQSNWNTLAVDDRYFVYSVSNHTNFIERKTGISFPHVFDGIKKNANPSYKFCIPHSSNQYFVGGEVSYGNVIVSNDAAKLVFADSLKNKIFYAMRNPANGHLYLLLTNCLYERDVTGKEKKMIDSFSVDFYPAGLFSFGNYIVISTSTGKLILYSLGSVKKMMYNLKGLIISNILPITNNTFIATTNAGASLVTINNKQNISIQKIVYPFSSSDIYNIYSCGSHLLMNVNNNLYEVDPAIINKHTTKPTFFINNILVSNQKRNGNHIFINSNSTGNITISLNALYFGNPNISYQYRFIKGHDRGQWLHSDGGQLNLLLPSYGNYTIEFAAVADNNNTSASQFLYVSWPPPFYLTWWFFAILGLLFIALVIYMVYLNNQRRKLKFNREMDMLQLEHKAINSLLNPHFVFNAINNIQNLVNKYRVDDANEYLARLSRLIRQNIENLQFNLITAEKELSLVLNYIYLQNLRFANKIHLQINNTADADTLYLPPLLIHTFVENSVVHGFSPDIKDFTITIDIHPDGKDYVDIIITDNGLGLNKPTQAQQALKDKTSIGVDATRRRLQKLSEFYKVDYKLDITDRQATDGVPGAKVSIRFYAHFGNLLPVN